MGFRCTLRILPLTSVCLFFHRSILTVPWIELGGSVAITCQKTGYHAKVEFLTKPFYGGKRHQIAADIFAPGEKKPFQTITGEWNGAMHVSYAKTGVRAHIRVPRHVLGFSAVLEVAQ